MQLLQDGWEFCKLFAQAFPKRGEYILHYLTKHSLIDFINFSEFFSALRKQLGARYHYSQSYYAKSPKTNDFRAGK